jgi:hypothetical protein
LQALLGPLCSNQDFLASEGWRGTRADGVPAPQPTIVTGTTQIWQALDGHHLLTHQGDQFARVLAGLTLLRGFGSDSCVENLTLA